jgi:hypothetical protein
VLRETTSRGLCELGCPSRTSERGGEGDCVKEGGGGSSRLGIEPKTPGWLVQEPTTSPSGDLADPNHQGIWSPPRAGLESTMGASEAHGQYPHYVPSRCIKNQKESSIITEVLPTTNSKRPLSSHYSVQPRRYPPPPCADTYRDLTIGHCEKTHAPASPGIALGAAHPRCAPLAGSQRPLSEG